MVAYNDGEDGPMEKLVEEKLAKIREATEDGQMLVYPVLLTVTTTGTQEQRYSIN